MFNILLVEDDKNIIKIIAEFLKMESFNVFLSENGEEALSILESIKVDLIITDLMMPKMDGFKFIKEVREYDSTIPILVLTAKEALEDKTTVFNLGCDDYMTKPISFEELLLRINALLRRAQIELDKKIIIGNSSFDLSQMICKQNNETIELTKKEFLIIFKLLSNVGKIYSRINIMDEIWGFDSQSDSRTVDVHIRRLREKFINNKDFQIITIKGVGYKAVKIDD